MKKVAKYPEKVTLPALAIRDVIVFPFTRSPIFMGRDKSIKAAELSRGDYESRILLITQKDARVDNPEQKDLYEVATLANLEQLLRLPDGTVKALVYGLERYRVLKVFEENGSLFAECERVAPPVLSDKEKALYVRALREVWKTAADLDRTQMEVFTKYGDVEDLDNMIGIVASAAKFSTQEKAEVLMELGWGRRIERISELLEREVQLRDIQQRIDNRVKRQMEKNQREYYLNEQIKAIRRELGDDNPEGETNEFTEWEEKIRKAKLPSEVEKAARQELKRLRQMPPMSSEAAVVRSYLDNLLEIPWTKSSRVSTDLKKARQILDEDHAGLDKIKDRILEYLAVQKRVGKMKAPILCLVGAPGVGKTSLGESIARATGRKYVRMALGGVHDESEIRGHRRTYVGSMPGQIIKAMIRAGVRNPLFLLDEIDKLGHDYRGDPAAALLEVLDPEQNNTFQDHYIELNYDLSDVMFVATSNSYNIPGPLLDRMEVISLSGYTEEEKLNIARKHLIPKQLRLNGLVEGEVEITDDAIRGIVRYYTREAGVRGLERSIGSILRKVVLARETGDGAEDKPKTRTSRRMKRSEPVQLTRVEEKDLHTYLGIPRFTVEFAEKEPRVGVVNGLAWTEVGGDLLLIEAQVFPGKGNIQRTGSLGDVMKESVEAARSVVRARAEQFGIKSDVFYSTDLHVHYPDGATPKDGPSAGAATTTAIVSAMTGIAVRSDVAMTGEINLHGDVLPIGGLKEKVLAALRAGCKTVIIPEENRRDIEDIPEGARKALDIVPVKSIDDVLKLALVRMPEPLKESKKKEVKSESAAIVPPKKRTGTKRQPASVN